MRARVATILAALACAGCSMAYRVGAGPTVDTEGRVGIQVHAGGAIGVGSEDGGWAIEETLEAAAGTELVPGSFVLAPLAGLDFARQGERLGGRIGLRGGGHFAFGDGEPRARWLSGLAAALFVPLDGGEASIGAELRASLLADDAYRAGHFHVGVVYEVREIDDLDDLFERH